MRIHMFVNKISLAAQKIAKEKIRACVLCFRTLALGLFKKSQAKMILVVPYRDREENLRKFIPAMRTHLQGVAHQIVVIEQAGHGLFNRAKLFNIGFALHRNANAYFCFHDVDLVPEDISFSYTYPLVPTHLVERCSHFNYVPFSSLGCNYWGGAVLFNKEDFKKINGFSNQYWGWGGEDDDLYKRIRQVGYLPFIKRRGRYRSLEHLHPEVRDPSDPRHHANIKRTNNPHYAKNLALLGEGDALPYEWKKDGLNSLEYELLETKFCDGYIKYLVKIDSSKTECLLKNKNPNR